MLLNKKRKLIFEFEDSENGVFVTTRVKGKLTLKDVLCAKQVIIEKLKDNGKDKRK